ncbi:hypothetical protein KSF73_03145 [Burkholderiaceae bacterium DAT-1]|nr:hypothetical protein [Burkholderiaceae bacterium DAT-1]
MITSRFIKHFAVLSVLASLCACAPVVIKDPEVAKRNAQMVQAPAIADENNCDALFEKAGFPKTPKEIENGDVKGWAAIGFDIDASGKPLSVRNAGSSGSTILESYAKQAIEESTFKTNSARKACIAMITINQQ